MKSSKLKKLICKSIIGLLVDEIDKVSPRDQTFLLSLMETGILTETKYGKTREGRN